MEKKIWSIFYVCTTNNNKKENMKEIEREKKMLKFWKIFLPSSILATWRNLHISKQQDEREYEQDWERRNTVKGFVISEHVPPRKQVDVWENPLKSQQHNLQETPCQHHSVVVLTPNTQHVLIHISRKNGSYILVLSWRAVGNYWSHFELTWGDDQSHSRHQTVS